MSIQHDKDVPMTDQPVVFAELGGFTCSICAPNSMVKREIQAFASARFKGDWVSINKADLGMGSPTPNPCNHWPEARTHWFMMRNDT